MTVTDAKKPDDIASPGLTPDDVYEFGNEYTETAIQDGDRPRATAISSFAQEMGCRFIDVRCRRRWMKLLTRQESYEGRAMDDQLDQWGESTDDTRSEAEVMTVPPNWTPEEDDPVWCFCEKKDAGAIACWVLVEKPDAK